MKAGELTEKLKEKGIKSSAKNFRQVIQGKAERRSALQEGSEWRVQVGVRSMDVGPEGEVSENSTGRTARPLERARSVPIITFARTAPRNASCIALSERRFWLPLPRK